jgi:hypothetical protein
MSPLFLSRQTAFYLSSYRSSSLDGFRSKLLAMKKSLRYSTKEVLVPHRSVSLLLSILFQTRKADHSQMSCRR